MAHGLGKAALACFLGFLLVSPGCDRRNQPAANKPSVTVYASVDDVFAAAVLNEFRKQTGIEVKELFDNEATKTTGLAQRLARERKDPVADVFWASEPFWTMRLAGEGLFAPYTPATAGEIPAQFKDPGGLWTGVAARARVIGYNTRLVKAEDAPKSLHDLADTKWKGKLAVSDPRFGTARGHIGAMYAVWGEDDFRRFLSDLQANAVRVVDSNGTAIRLTARGEVHVCLTDTDDVWAAQRNGEPVEAIYPNADGHGTFLFPATVALVKKPVENPAARKLVDFLTSAECERLLAESDSHNVPVRPAVAGEYPKYRVPKIMSVGYDKVLDSIEPAMRVWNDVMASKTSL